MFKAMWRRWRTGPQDLLAAVLELLIVLVTSTWTLLPFVLVFLAGGGERTRQRLSSIPRRQRARLLKTIGALLAFEFAFLLWLESTGFTRYRGWHLTILMCFVFAFANLLRHPSPVGDDQVENR